MDHRPLKTLPYFPACHIFRHAILFRTNENRGFQTDFVTVLDTSKRACTIKDSTVFFFCVNEQNGFKNSTCKRLFWETEKRI